MNCCGGTETEKNNFGFEIQRKDEGSDFVKIGFIPGEGTYLSSKQYHFLDEPFDIGTFIYRIKQIDFDGSFSISDKVSVNISFPDKFEIKQNYPNPFNAETTIEFYIPDESKVKIQIYDLT